MSAMSDSVSSESAKPVSLSSDMMKIIDAIEIATGKRLHIGSIRRWYRKGVAGVRLKVVWLGGEYQTTPELVKQFIEQSTAAKLASYEKPKLSVDEHISPLKCSEAVDAAVKKFNAMGPSKKRGRPPKASTTSSSALV